LIDVKRRDSFPCRGAFLYSSQLHVRVMNLQMALLMNNKKTIKWKYSKEKGEKVCKSSK